MSPVMLQELRAVVVLDDATHLGPYVQPMRQTGNILALAAGAGTHSGIILYPGIDGLWIEEISTSGAANIRVGFRWPPALAPPGWVTSTLSFGTPRGYNPADPGDPPTATGLGIGVGGIGIDSYMSGGSMTTAGLNSADLYYAFAAGDQWPVAGLPFFVPPDQVCFAVTVAADVTQPFQAVVTDPTFRTRANL